MKHLHKYKLKDLTRDPKKDPYYVYVCVKQECDHHVRIELIDGKRAECFRCGDPFEIRLNKIKHGKQILHKLHCDSCTWAPRNGKVSAKKEEVKKKISNIDFDDLLSSILPKEHD